MYDNCAAASQAADRLESGVVCAPSRWHLIIHNSCYEALQRFKWNCFQRDCVGDVNWLKMYYGATVSMIAPLEPRGWIHAISN